jgi:hypothetical protein
MGTVMTIESVWSELDPSVIMKLETGGLSIGSLMSYAPEPAPHAPNQQLGRAPPLSAAQPVDFGLEAIGTSFGSMSLAVDSLAPTEGEATDRPASFEAQPTFLQQAKSKGSLLTGVHTDDEEEDESSQRQQSFMGGGTRESGSGGAGSGPNQSAGYEQLKAALEAQNYVNPTASTSSTYSTNSTTLMSPPTQPIAAGAFFSQQQWAMNAGVDSQFVIPTTTFDRDFSQMSALSVDDAEFQPVLPVPHDHHMPLQSGQPQQQTPSGEAANTFGDSATMPPPQLRKQESEDLWEPADHLLRKQY